MADRTCFERAGRIGGLLRYGIPDFKMEKRFLDRRLDQLAAEGVTFRPNTNVGVDLPARDLLSHFDAVCLCGGATQPRDLPIDGRELDGIHFAMPFLTAQNQRVAGDDIPDSQFISARDKDVIIIGGGDTGADCLGTSHRQGAASVTQLEIMPKPAIQRALAHPWPTYPLIYRISSAHEEGGDRVYAVSTEEFAGDADGRVRDDDRSITTEAEAMIAARAQGVPVAELYDYGSGPLGPAYLLLEHLDGETIPRRLLRDDTYAAARPRLARRLGEVLARLHRVDPDTIPGLTQVDALGQLNEL